MFNSKSPRHPERAVELQRRARQVPHRLDRHCRSAASSRRCSTRRRTTRTASAACTSSCRGGSTTRSSTSRAAITSRSAAAATCPATGSAAASTTARRHGGGYGEQLKDDYRRYYGATVGFAGRGEMVPNEDCYCEIDPNASWTSGASRCCASTGSGATPRSAGEAHAETFREIIQEMGGECSGRCRRARQDYGLEAGGRIIHEAGATRMGNDPHDSVLNEWCQAHE